MCHDDFVAVDGGLATLLDGKLAAGVTGDLLMHTGARSSRDFAYRARSNALRYDQADEGWLFVTAEFCAEDSDLARWVQPRLPTRAVSHLNSCLRRDLGRA